MSPSLSGWISRQIGLAHNTISWCVVLLNSLPNLLKMGEVAKGDVVKEDVAFRRCVIGAGLHRDVVRVYSLCDMRLVGFGSIASVVGD